MRNDCSNNITITFNDLKYYNCPILKVMIKGCNMTKKNDLCFATYAYAVLFLKLSIISASYFTFF